MNQQLRELEMEYSQMLLPTIKFQTSFPIVYRGKRVAVEDCDDTLNDPASLSVTENHLLNALPSYNTRIRYSRIKESIDGIKEDSLNVKRYVRRIFRELRIGRLTLYQDIDAGFDTAMMTIPVENAYEGNMFLSGHSWVTKILSAGGSNPVNSFLAIKVGMPRFSNLASRYIYDEKGVFTGRCVFYYGRNRAIGMKKIMMKEGVTSEQCRVIDDTLPSLPFMEAISDGVFICVSEHARVKQLEESNSRRPHGPIVVFRPEIRKNFYYAVGTLLKFEKIQQIGSALSPPELSKALHKIELVRSQGTQLLGSDEIKFAMNVDDFSNNLTELLFVEELKETTKILNADSRIKKLKSTPVLEEKKDIVDALVQELDENLREQGIREEFVKKIDELSNRWKAITGQKNS